MKIIRNTCTSSYAINKFCSQCQNDKFGGGDGDGSKQGTCLEKEHRCLKDGTCKVRFVPLNLSTTYVYQGLPPIS